ncbi:CHASE domain-containing protein [Duganella sp. sic0402]|uniref:sensor domain-containing diguanylate cyclase n=1 Tax=Duganella sp. sic0402 TaxID=2854786 RepID=UPI001C46C04A|nr:CHASE domain-containing protein [Duganella sp. sic0402]MBV7538384.1 CHASE domain-containing protein [Duganella sp. sic0402]
MPHRAQARPRRLLQDLLAPGILPVLVLSGCLGVTAILWRGAVIDAEQDAQADFEGRVRELVNNLDQRMQTYVQVLYGVQGLFASSQLVDREEFRTYLTGQDLNHHFPGVHGVGYIQLVDGRQREAHEAAVRREGFPDYRIQPEGARAWYAPIVYLEPFNDNNRRAFGYDTASESHRRVALEQARDSGQPAMSSRIRLVQEGGEPPQAGFLVVLPLYRPLQQTATLAQRRAAISGWVYAPFRIGDLMAGLGGQRAAALDVEIYDGDAVDAEALMHDSVPNADGEQRSTRQQISIANHRWTLRISMPQGAAPERSGDKARQMAAFGASLSVLLGALTWLLARGRVRARESLARSRALTIELKEGQTRLMAMADSAQRSQSMLRSILDSTIDGILVDNLQGSVLNSNRRFRELWNVPEQLDWQADGAVLMTHMCAQLRHPDCGLRLEPTSQEGTPAPTSEVLQLNDGRVIETHTRGLQLGAEPARLWSFRDITERTRIEQREQTRRHVLELLATGAPLQTILESVVLGVEADNEDMLCSILLLDESGEHLLVGAAPSLPAFFNAAMHGKSIHSGLGACGQAVLTRGRVIVEDIRSAPSWAEYRDLALQAQLCSCWSDPIISTSGAVLGTFAIYHREARVPSLANIALIEQGARLAGIAIEQAQAAAALRAGEARFRSLYDHAPVALWEQDWSALRGALAELELTGVDDLAAYLQANPSQLRRLASLVRIVDVNAAALQQVAASGKQASELTLAQNFDASAMPNFARAVAALAQGQHLFACEGSFERLDGVARLNELTLLVMPGHTHSLDFVIVSTLDITERRRMNDELRVLATTDFLTGLPNRREFMGRLAEEEGRLQRDIGASAAVLVLDIDHFKRINDEYGHAAGDAVLRQLADLMRDGQRKIDVLGRIGGEEFAVLLPGTALDAAAVFAERLRARVEQMPMRLDDGVTLNITVSIGIAALGGKTGGGDLALIRADQALYCAKRGGRNRVELMDAEADRPGHQVPAASG